MRKLFYLGFCAVLAMGIGCAITNYDLITDNDQVYKDNCTFPNCPATVNTNGKAHIIESSQVATIWDDGVDELFTNVDQKANGDRTLTTYNNFSTFDGPWWHDDFYCNPDWNGCAIWTAPDPQTGDVSLFDGQWNQNCLGSRSLFYLISTPRYYGECGRDVLADKIGMLNATYEGTFRNELGLMYDFSMNNTTLNVGGNLMSIPDGTFFINPISRHAAFDATDPRMHNLRRQVQTVWASGTVSEVSLTASGYNVTREAFRL
jgi:hypothetical protein